MENDAESSTNPIPQGCGSNNNISVQISPTTGGDFALSVDPGISIESLKKMVSKKLKVPRDRICLLFREKYVFLLKKQDVLFKKTSAECFF